MNINEVEKHVKFDLIFTLLIIFMVGLCFLLSIVFIFKPDSVKAQTQSTDLNSSIFADCGGSRVYNKYCDFKGNRSPQYVSRSLNTTINGTTDQISFGFQRQMSAYSQYIVNVYAMSTDFRNNDLSVVVYGSNTENSINNVMNNATFTFISKNLIQIVIPENSYIYHYIVITGDSLTGIDSYGVKKITLSWDDGSTDMSGVIDNQTQNTQNIINNANSNTENITNSITDMKNTIVNDTVNIQREQLNSLCSNSYKFNFNKGKAFYSNGSMYNSEWSFYTEDYIPIGSGVTKLYIQNVNDNGSGGNIIIYDSSKNYLDYWGVRNQSFNLPSGAAYFRIASTYPGVLITKNSACEKTEDKIYSYLQDNSDPTIDNNAITNTFNSVQSNNPLSYLLTLPTDLLTAILNGLSSNTCQDFEIGKFGHVGRHDLGTYTFKFPCINIQEKLGSNLYNTIDLFVSIGILVITIVKLYNTISSYLTLGAEDEVKSHSHFLTPMDFLGNILGGNISGVGNSINNGGNL